MRTRLRLPYVLEGASVAAMLLIAAYVLWNVIGGGASGLQEGWEPLNPSLEAALHEMRQKDELPSSGEEAGGDALDPSLPGEGSTAGIRADAGQEPGTGEAAPLVDSAGEAEPDGRLDVNRAGLEQFLELPGIGPVKGMAIVEHRRQHGAFRSVEDLLEVKGIGPATLDKIRDQLKAGAP